MAGVKTALLLKEEECKRLLKEQGEDVSEGSSFYLMGKAFIISECSLIEAPETIVMKWFGETGAYFRLKFLYTPTQ